MTKIASDSMSHANAQEIERNDRPGRSAEFKSGATSEDGRNAIDASRIPSIKEDPWYGAAGTGTGADIDYERNWRWSQ